MKHARHLIRRLHWPSIAIAIAALTVAVLLAAVAVVGLGLYNVSARVGHLPGISWVLHSTFRHSVALRADARPPATLNDPGMIALGAGHYEQACAMCHGRPGEGRTATGRAMVPVPPHIQQAAPRWSAAELHWLIREGVKMSGMPHWPATRQDDIWPVVAFLRQVADMDADAYVDLTGGERRGSCRMCHGESGVSTNPQVPRLDILSPDYIAASLRAYRDGDRDSGIMAEAASRLDDDAIARLASAFGDPSPIVSARPSGPLVDRGRKLASESPRARVPSCQACHGPWPEPLNRGFPSVSGQHEPYLTAQLRLWRDGPRGGGEMAELMHHAARDLADGDIAALAAYYAARLPAPINPAQKSVPQ